MSALGQEWTSAGYLAMSALPHKADIAALTRKVRFATKSGSMNRGETASLFDHFVGELLGSTPTQRRSPAHSRIASAEDLDRAVDRGPQEIVGLGLLVLGRNDLMSRRNGRHEIVQMPMTEHWQARQRRRIGFGIDRYIEIGLVVILVSGRKPSADIGVSVPRRECDQSSDIEVVRPAAHGRGREFAPNHLSLDGAEQKSGIAEPSRKLG